MGFASLIDILGSMIIGGILMMIAWRLSDASTERTYNYSGELALQQNLKTIVEIIEYDFRKIGYCDVPGSLPDTIVYADSNRIDFYTDCIPLNGAPNIDLIRYYIGPTSECSGTPNPRDRILYRVVNNETPILSNLGVTQFKLVFMDALGDTLPSPVGNPNLIKTIEINVAVESVAAYDTLYSHAIWRQSEWHQEIFQQDKGELINYVRKSIFICSCRFQYPFCNNTAKLWLDYKSISRQLH